MARTVLDGARDLLVRTARLLDKAGVSDYVIVGGWCPALRNKCPLEHPGTLDVDILFGGDSEDNSVAAACTALMEDGMLPSAKHSFQLLAPTNVGSERLVYNVDILHPQMDDMNSSLFVDHLDLDIPFDEDELKLKKMASIMLPNSAVIFEEDLFDYQTVAGVDIPVIDWTGMWLTKIDSCQKVKRNRDSFDLLLALENNGIQFRTLRRLMDSTPRIRKSIESFQNFLNADGHIFDGRVREFAAVRESPAAKILNILNQEL